MNHTLTVAYARNTKPPSSGDFIVRDTKTQGLGLRVYSSGEKRWVFQKKFAGKPLRISLGSIESLPLESKFDPKANRSIKGAKQLAEEYSALIRQGIDPRQQIKRRIEEAAKEKLSNELTVKFAWKSYINFKKSLRGKYAPKDRTIKDWQKIEQKLSNGLLWKVQIINLTAEKLIQEIQRLTAQPSSHGATNSGMTQASLVMRNLRAVYNHTIEQYNLDIDVHAFKVLNKKMPGWDKTNARSRRVGELEGTLHKWWLAVDQFSNSANLDTRAIGDWLKLCLLWGGRRTELLSLKWDQVNLEQGFVLIPSASTKNKRDHLIPITSYVRTILEKRYQDVFTHNRSAQHNIDVRWLFPSSRTSAKTGHRSHIKSPGKAIKRVVEQSGVPFSPHDLRRTFASLLSESGATDMTVKRALNHTPDSTAAKFYVNNPRLKSLRATYQVLEDTILSEAGIAALSTSMQTITMSQSEYALYTEFKKGKLGLEAQG